jgi:hypothetical protein
LRSRRLSKVKLVKLDDAAQRLGCHVETLRLRIRSGHLKALRGPHGAYYISGRSLAGLRVGKSRATPPPSAVDLELAWKTARQQLMAELAGKRLSDERLYERLEARLNKGGLNAAAYFRLLRLLRLGPDANETVAPFLRALKGRPETDIRSHRVLLARGLAEMGFDTSQVAAELRVSDRHARRLMTKQGLAFAEPVLRGARLWASRAARRLVAELRSQLQAEGFQFHRWTMRGARAAGPPTRRDRPRPAFKVKKLTREERIGLQRAGLTSEQIWAITVVGLGSDELNELLLRGVH